MVEAEHFVVSFWRNYAYLGLKWTVYCQVSVITQLQISVKLENELILISKFIIVLNFNIRVHFALSSISGCSLLLFVSIDCWWFLIMIQELLKLHTLYKNLHTYQLYFFSCLWLVFFMIYASISGLWPMWVMIRIQSYCYVTVVFSSSKGFKKQKKKLCVKT